MLIDWTIEYTDKIVLGHTEDGVLELEPDAIASCVLSDRKYKVFCQFFNFELMGQPEYFWELYFLDSSNDMFFLRRGTIYLLQEIAKDHAVQMLLEQVEDFLLSPLEQLTRQL